jgi:exopolysaccharide biosynthesis polyprenyl glycosylphosphotransferase
VISTRAKQTSYLLAFAEAILLSLAFSCAFAMRALVPIPVLRDGSGLDFNVHAWMLTIGIPLYWLLAWGHSLYEPASIRGRSSMLLSMTKVFVYLATALGLAVFLFQAKAFSRAVFFLFLVFGLLFVVLNRLALATLGKRTGVEAHELHDVLVVGTGLEAVEVRTKLATHRELAMRVVGHLTGPAPAPMAVEASEIIGGLQDLKRIIEERVVDDVIFAIPVVDSLACEREIGWCEEVGVTVHLRVDLVKTLFARMSPSDFDGTPMLTISATPRQPVALLIKRSLDLLGAAVALAALAPLVAVTATLIKATSRGPVFFKQTRVGLNGRMFTLFKFRSMYRDAESRRAALADRNEMSGPVFKIKDDPRITPVGRWIRRFSIDELPQLWNVLRGDMSLVGPRPPIPEEVQKYERWQRRRLSMKPGITCLWQVSGRNGIDFDDWMKLDLAYIDTWSLRLDALILLRTVPVVLTARGAH